LHRQPFDLLPNELTVIIGGHVMPQDRPNWRLASSMTLHAARTSQHSVRWRLADGDEQLAARVLASYVNVRVFVLRGTAAVRTLMSALGSLVGLQSLDLRGYGAGAAALAPPSIGALTGLSARDLSRSGIGAAGAAALAPSIGALIGLSALDLSHNSIGATGAVALAPSIRALAGLRSLEMSWNSIGEAGAAALAPSIRELTGLRSLTANTTYNGTPGSVDHLDHFYDV
jgi:hypothetical protein